MPKLNYRYYIAILGNIWLCHWPSITGTSLSDCLLLYPGHSLCVWGGLTPLQRCSWCILQPQLTGQIYKRNCYLTFPVWLYCLKFHVLKIVIRWNRENKITKWRVSCFNWWLYFQYMKVMKLTWEGEITFSYWLYPALQTGIWAIFWL